MFMFNKELKQNYIFIHCYKIKEKKNNNNNDFGGHHRPLKTTFFGFICL